VAGTVKVVGPAVRWSETPARIDRPAPLVGQHTREVLEEFGRSPSDIDGLIAAGVAGEPS
jgi:crotonobetainyl-CoA:carnitine CoA-transferase CaiB-like acyl-CoA transferase